VWDQVAIDERTTQMVDRLIATWPVPDGHVGEVVDRQAAAPSWIEIKDLVAAGLLTPGTTLVPREGQWASRTALIQDDGRIGIDDRAFDTPSGAAAYVKGGASNGWSFWRLEDGTRLADVRTHYRAQQPRRPDAPFDWSRLHEILERLPEGRWTSYSELSDAIGSAPQAVGNHVGACAQCTNAYRVLTYDGQISPGFKWHDPTDIRDPADVLRAEGVAIVDGKADSSRTLISDDLVALLEG
jgi:alkylated DNA nucleotide flippase Atl1